MVGEDPAELLGVGVVAQVLLADAQGAAGCEAGDVDVEAGAGADDDVRAAAGQIGAGPEVGETAVLAVPLVLRREVRGGLRLGRIAQVGAVRADVHQGDERDPGVDREARCVQMAGHRGDLHVVVVRERRRQVQRRTDGAADGVRVVQQKHDLLAAAQGPTFPMA